MQTNQQEEEEDCCICCIWQALIANCNESQPAKVVIEFFFLSEQRNIWQALIANWKRMSSETLEEGDEWTQEEV